MPPARIERAVTEGAALLRLTDEGDRVAEGEVGVAGPFDDEPILTWDVPSSEASFSSRHE